MDRDKNSSEFLEIIGDVLEHEDVKKLNMYAQHWNTSRLQHSINVAYYSYAACKRLGLDYRSAARAGVLHDLFLYDWHKEKQPEGFHAFAHPKVALRNARAVTDLNAIEEDAILNHMWPVTPNKPRYAEGLVLSFADKYSACVEMGTQSAKAAKVAWKTLKTAWNGAW